jgi:hypothetical protein
MQSAIPASPRESSHRAFSGGIQKVGQPGAPSVMTVPSVDSAEAASYGRGWERGGVWTIANHSAHESGAQLPCRPQYPRIRTYGKRTAHGVRVIYREVRSTSLDPVPSPFESTPRITYRNARLSLPRTSATFAERKATIICRQRLVLQARGIPSGTASAKMALRAKATLAHPSPIEPVSATLSSSAKMAPRPCPKSCHFVPNRCILL